MAGELKGNWHYPTPIRFGNGRIAELADACTALGMRRPLLVTDRGLAGLDITGSARGHLAAGGLGDATFAGVDPNPTGANLDAGLEAYRAGGHDGVVAFGGGSALDLGKAVAFMARQTRPVWDFEDVDDWWTRADPDAIDPIVAVPTTAGTGSEVGRAAVLTNETTHEKKIVFHPRMLPGVVICGPELTVGLPPAITAGTGMDAFAHCLEAYCSPHFHPMSQGIALEGMRLVDAHLERAYRDGSDLEARAQLLAAAAMGATAFQKGLGAIHALSHPVGAVHGTHHGTTNATVMAPVLDFNRPAVEGRLAAAARYLGLADIGDTEARGFDAFRERVVALNEALGIPRGLAELGVIDPDLDALTASALADPSVGGNPVPMTPANVRALLEACL